MTNLIIQIYILDSVRRIVCGFAEVRFHVEKLFRIVEWFGIFIDINSNNNTELI